MITMKDPALTVYPDRQQMLALIRAQTVVGAGDSIDEQSSAQSETHFTTCIFVPQGPTAGAVPSLSV
jgi:hypothetical protein